jgi:hypothetical protein
MPIADPPREGGRKGAAGNLFKLSSLAVSWRKISTHDAGPVPPNVLRHPTAKPEPRLTRLTVRPYSGEFCYPEPTPKGLNCYFHSNFEPPNTFNVNKLQSPG